MPKCKIKHVCADIVNCQSIYHLDVPLFIFLIALLTESGVKNTFVIFTPFGAVRSKTGATPSSSVPMEQKYEFNKSAFSVSSNTDLPAESISVPTLMVIVMFALYTVYEIFVIKMCMTLTFKVGQGQIGLQIYQSIPNFLKVII